MRIRTIGLFKQWLLIIISALLLPLHATAQDIFRMTGAAKFEIGDDFHRLSFPVNPITAASLTFEEDTFIYHETGSSCSVKVRNHMRFYTDPIISKSFGSVTAFDTFLSNKFHISGTALADTYVLSDADEPLCSGLRSAMIYKSTNEILVLSGSWIYLFEHQTHAPANAELSFDCVKAGTNVEHLICHSPELMKLDATVNRGYVAMMLVDSQEISYQDSVRQGQLEWLRNVRNKCDTQKCLLDAYSSRIRYIKSRITRAYPSYPMKESEQDGD